METDILVAQEAERDLDGIKRTLTFIGIGYAGLVFLACYADYKIKMRRARKKREREEQELDGRPKMG